MEYKKEEKQAIEEFRKHKSTLSL